MSTCPVLPIHLLELESLYNLLKSAPAFPTTTLLLGKCGEVWENRLSAPFDFQ